MNKTNRKFVSTNKAADAKNKAADAVSRRPTGPLNPYSKPLPDDCEGPPVTYPALKRRDTSGSVTGVTSPPQPVDQVTNDYGRSPALKPEDASGRVKGAISNHSFHSESPFSPEKPRIALSNFLSAIYSHKSPDSNAIAALSSLQVVTWEKVKLATASDKDMEGLLTLVESGFPSCKMDVPTNLQVFFIHRKHLRTSDGVVLYKDRLVIPNSLRKTILSLLHCAHQGTSRMIARAEASVFWPGITSDIRAVANLALCATIWHLLNHLPHQLKTIHHHILFKRYVLISSHTRGDIIWWWWIATLTGQ